jgi:hypothetical protein
MTGTRGNDASDHALKDQFDNADRDDDADDNEDVHVDTDVDEKGEEKVLSGMEEGGGQDDDDEEEEEEEEKEEHTDDDNHHHGTALSRHGSKNSIRSDPDEMIHALILVRRRDRRINTSRHRQEHDDNDIDDDGEDSIGEEDNYSVTDDEDRFEVVQGENWLRLGTRECIPAISLRDVVLKNHKREEDAIAICD